MPSDLSENYFGKVKINAVTFSGGECIYFSHCQVYFKFKKARIVFYFPFMFCSLIL